MLRLGRYKKSFLLVLVVAALGFTANITARNSLLFNKIESPAISLLKPAQELFSWISGGVRNGIESVAEVFYLKRENEALKKQLAELEEYRHKFLEYRDENARLRRMLEFKEKNPQYDLVAAEVIGRDPGNWFNVIIINKGKNSGITKDMAVVTERGLVGYTVDVGNNWAKVLMLLDNRMSVSAMIQRTRDNGILKGNIAPAPPGHAKMVFLPADASIVKGDVVITSGMGGIVPKGIIIGEVVEVKKETDNLTQYAIVKPAVDFHKLEEVFVIKNANADPGRE
ncbi:rod shape-determining protein MreC [Thermosediminibacter oceani]|uniref:Cell shape-determining protein MreC n=1 Tax=Thermosediminibacter oceani (strain ATCC BAA-1034 / DSM 16646 / JW/IW-1228P) TaxID=555079 RepID=D9S280_THEOJ|nr:rod shape-determining protein MreC [Thermosediminibacter oceani]ADL07507.1 rod shape-determining protein MreC [Thermosediminibacter oceani DSM 16646]